MIFIKILVLNSGSSSLKYKLINMKNEKVLCKGAVEKIGADNSEFFHQTSKGFSIHKYFYDITNYDDAFKHIKAVLLDEKY